MPPAIDLRDPGRPIRVGVVLMNSTTEILDIAPVDIFFGLSKPFVANFPDHLCPENIRKQALDVEFHWVTEHGQDAKMTAGGVIKATHDFKTCPPLDIIVMGAVTEHYNLTPGEIAFVQKCNEDCAALLFVCGGFMAALQAGLLEGKTATGPRPALEGLRKASPGVNWVARRWANDGKIWTSGTLLNGTDMTKAFAEHVWGGEGSLVEFSTRLGGYPVRDVEYADVPWEL